MAKNKLGPYKSFKYLIFSGSFTVASFLGLFGSANAHALEANSMRFASGLYTALAAIESGDLHKFDIAHAQLNLALEFAPNKEARGVLLNAISTLVSRTQGNSRYPTTAELQLVVAQVKAALQYNVFPSNGVHPGESVFLYDLIRAHLFPESWQKVRIEFDGVDKTTGLGLIGLYLTDPRSAKYDPNVAALFGIRQEGQGSYIRVRFILPSEDFDLNPADLDDVENAIESGNYKASQTYRRFEGVFKKLVKPGSPIIPKVKFVGSRVSIHFEVMGLQSAPIVASYMRTVLSVANGNRYIYAASTQVGKFARNLRATDFSNVSTLQSSLTKVATALEGVESTFNSHLLSAGWDEPTHDTVKKTLLRRKNIEIEHIENSIANEISEKINKNVYLTDAERAERLAKKEAKRLQKIAAVEAEYSKTVQSVDAAIKKFREKPNFSKIPVHIQSDELRKVAEKAAGVKTITWDRAIRFTSYFLLAETLLRGIPQYMRATDKMEQLQIYNDIGIQFLHNLIYFVPAAGEIVAIIDVSGPVLDMTFLAWANHLLNSNYQSPTFEDIMQYGIYWTQNAGFYYGGSSRAEVELSEVLSALQVPSVYRYRGVVYDSASERVSRLLQQKEPLSDQQKQQLQVEKNKLVSHIRDLTQKYVSLAILIEDRYQKRGNLVAQAFLEDSIQKLTAAEGGYLIRVSRLLNGSL